MIGTVNVADAPGASGADDGVTEPAVATDDGVIATVGFTFDRV